ncbi:prephenate dehydrogenase dimerization domain-containing protein [Helicobacter heilmannii]|uniref:prephenate dehydrogenase dimerization domain-containing protein n=1 Tax=Helicobacter heilmannii TaxID=35817 RepID=UPI001E5CECBF|nr:prephenate dehydrogenase dimerization domain-containing protein [Helicobacter heilmannii]
MDCDRSAPEHVERAKEIFSAIGMQLVKMDAPNHDAHIAFVSHLPHAISYALANVVLSQKSPQTILSLAAGGFKDMSRLSKSSPVMWRSVFKQNKEQVLKAMGAFLEEMGAVQGLLENEDWEALEAWMGRANQLQEFI